MQGPKIDKVVFWVALIVIVCFSAPLVMFPAEGKAVLNTALAWTTKTLGWAYLWFTIAAFGILIYYAFGLPDQGLDWDVLPKWQADPGWSTPIDHP